MAEKTGTNDNAFLQQLLNPNYGKKARSSTSYWKIVLGLALLGALAYFLYRHYYASSVQGSTTLALNIKADSANYALSDGITVVLPNPFISLQDANMVYFGDDNNTSGKCGASGTAAYYKSSVGLGISIMIAGAGYDSTDSSKTAFMAMHKSLLPGYYAYGTDVRNCAAQKYYACASGSYPLFTFCAGLDKYGGIQLCMNGSDLRKDGARAILYSPPAFWTMPGKPGPSKYNCTGGTNCTFVGIEPATPGDGISGTCKGMFPNNYLPQDQSQYPNILRVPRVGTITSTCVKITVVNTKGVNFWDLVQAAGLPMRADVFSYLMVLNNTRMTKDADAANCFLDATAMDKQFAAANYAPLSQFYESFFDDKNLPKLKIVPQGKWIVVADLPPGYSAPGQIS
jgi:hypothetical protein